MDRATPPSGCWLALVAIAGCGRVDFEPAIARLVAHYPLDDNPSAGATADVSGHHLDGACTANGCPTLVPGVVGMANHFDGNQAFLVADDALLHLTHGFTISLWLRALGGVTALSKPQIAGIGASFELVARWAVSPETGEVAFCTDPDSVPDGEDCVFGSPLPDGVWSHVVMLWDGNAKQLIVDGTMVAHASALTVFDASPFVIGADRENGILSSAFIGDIDEIRIYDRAMDDADLAMLP